jgi:hypothetical protein
MARTGPQQAAHGETIHGRLAQMRGSNEAPCRPGTAPPAGAGVSPPISKEVNRLNRKNVLHGDIGEESGMLELGALFAVLLIVGVVFVAIKLLFALVMIPLKIGFGILKIVLFAVLGIPLLILGCVAVGIALPILAVGLVLAVLVAPFVLVAKVVS